KGNDLLKRRLEQALVLRGNRDFASVPAYVLASTRNRRNLNSPADGSRSGLCEGAGLLHARLNGGRKIQLFDGHHRAGA
ncbi:MAG: hypothetical protein JW751_25365, partial [Polyangiaceae bacterium]|nr:hypothetical protein [Polyangiaceae bacterium]